jgi:hypothetical protein
MNASPITLFSQNIVIHLPYHRREWFVSTAQGFAIGTAVVLIYALCSGALSSAFVIELLGSQLWSMTVYMVIAAVAGAIAYI